MRAQPALWQVEGTQGFLREPPPVAPVKNGCEPGRQGGDGHRNGRCSEHERVGPLRDRILADPLSGEQERELPDLEEAEANGERRDVRVAEGPRYAAEDQALGDEDQHHEKRYDPRLLPE